MPEDPTIRPAGPAARVRQSRVRRAREAMSPAPLPPVPVDVPVDVDRTTLYTSTELYGPGAYAASLDARTYAWSLEPGDHRAQVARALHDQAIDEALDTWLASRRLVGVMGGHDAQRGDPAYTDAAWLGHGIGARGLVVATGGGPGVMEAANLGCLLAEQPVEVLGSALTALARVPTYHPVDPWLTAARGVSDDLLAPLGPLHDSLGVPTWFYGHEPTNVFTTAIAKYLRNALREAILLQLCDAGIVFLPGAAGTVQEVFQDACENYYATGVAVAPMVLVGREFWTATLPAWPLLQALALGREMADRLHLVDSVPEAVARLAG